jgi:hypothetical protein
MKNSGSLVNAKLPKPIEALEPFKERLYIINGLHEKHTSPAHSPFFGAFGGYRGSGGVPPGEPTIDYELSKVLPQNLLPHLCIGMDSTENMRAKPTVANLSASGADFSASCLSLLDGTQWNSSRQTHSLGRSQSLSRKWW